MHTDHAETSSPMKRPPPADQIHARGQYFPPRLPLDQSLPLPWSFLHGHHLLSQRDLDGSWQRPMDLC